MPEPSWKVIQEKQEVEFHAQEDNWGVAGLLTFLFWPHSQAWQSSRLTLLHCHTPTPFLGFPRLAFCLLCAFLTSGWTVVSSHIAHQEKRLCSEPGRCCEAGLKARDAGLKARLSLLCLLRCAGRGSEWTSSRDSSMHTGRISELCFCLLLYCFFMVPVLTEKTCLSAAVFFFLFPSCWVIAQLTSPLWALHSGISLGCHVAFCFSPAPSVAALHPSTRAVLLPWYPSGIRGSKAHCNGRIWPVLRDLLYLGFWNH